MITYSTAQMQLDARGITHGFFTCCLCQPERVHAHTPAKGNDAGSSPPYSVHHAGFLILYTFVNIYSYMDCRVFNAVMYWPHLYL